MKPSLKPAKRITLSEDICQQLVNLIVSGELLPGSKLPSERELMEMFSVGRSSVRESLRALTLVGLVETKQGYGAVVAENSSDYLNKSITWASLAGLHTNLEIVEAREVIETGVIQLVASCATSDDIELLEQQLANMEANLSDIPTFAKLDVSFHTTLAEISSNRILLQFIVNLRGLLHQNILEDLKENIEMAQLSLNQHRKIVEAIKKGDAILASQAMRYHLKDVSERLLARVRDRGISD